MTKRSTHLWLSVFERKCHVSYRFPGRTAPRRPVGSPFHRSRSPRRPRAPGRREYVAVDWHGACPCSVRRSRFPCPGRTARPMPACRCRPGRGSRRPRALSVGQQRRRPAADAERDHVPRSRPGPAAPVVDLGGGALTCCFLSELAAGYEYPPIGQERRSVSQADPDHVPGDGPSSGAPGHTARPWAQPISRPSAGRPPRAPCHRAAALPREARGT